MKNDILKKLTGTINRNDNNDGEKAPPCSVDKYHIIIMPVGV